MKKIFITVLILFAALAALWFLLLNDGPEPGSRLDFVENFYSLERNFSMSEEELEKYLSNPDGVRVSQSFKNFIERELAGALLIGRNGRRAEIPGKAAADGIFRLVLKNSASVKASFEFKFRKNGSSWYSVKYKAGVLELSESINGSGKKLGAWRTHSGEKEKFIIHVIYFDDKLIVYESESGILQGFTGGLSGIKEGLVEYENPVAAGLEFRVKHVFIEGEAPGEMRTLLAGMKLGAGPSAYHWNSMYPEHRVNLTGDENSFLQRVQMDYVMRRSILMPLGSEITWEGQIPGNARLDFALGMIRKNVYNSGKYKIRLSVKVEDGSGMTHDYSVRQDYYTNGKWKEFRAELDKFAGKKARISFKALLPAGEIVPDSPPVFLLGNPVIHSKRSLGEMNVILISLDTLRADHLGSYGYSRNTSPAIDRFAEKGTLFKNAVTAAPWTLPGHISMLTGLYPGEGGYRQFRFQTNDEMWEAHANYSRLSHEVDSISEILKRNDYQTAALVLGGPVGVHHWFDQGFEEYGEKAYMLRDAAKEVKLANEWLEKNHENKFFLFFHLFEIHDPYTHEIFDDFNKDNNIDEIIARYDSGILYTDRQLDKFFRKLEELGLMEHTLVIITSDHGENFAPDMIINDHGNHGRTLYDCELMVPMICVGGSFPAETLVEDQVRTIDIVPTILDQIGLPQPENIRGLSMLNLAEGMKNRERAAYAEGILLLREIADKHALRTNRHKLIKNTADKINPDVIPYEFYDLKNDPLEKENKYRSAGSVFRTMLSGLEAIIESVRARGNLLPVPNAEGKSQSNEDLLNQLRNLGYVGN